MRWLVFMLLAACLSSQATTYNSDGSASDVQSKISGSSDGDTVTIPAGSFTWSSSVTNPSKGIKLQGAGAGGILGTSTSSVSLGTGAKSFTTQAGLSLSNGDAVTVYVNNIYLATTPAYVAGTVTSYSGTSLSISATSSAGSGTYGFWYVTKDASTIIAHNAGSAFLLDMTPSTGRSIELSGIKFVQGASATDGTHLRIQVGNGKPVLVHDCWFSTSQDMSRSISWMNNGGIIYKCFFDENFKWSADGGIVFNPDTLTTSWTNTSNWGANDTGGTNNTYVEDCWFANIATQATDVDNNARVVLRHNTVQNSAFNSHGKDSSPYGMRYCEVYNNTFVFDSQANNDSVNISWFVYMRGGSWVVTDNVIPNITSSTWGDKNEVVATIYSLRYQGCYTNYPAPHQIGRGITTGTDLVNGDLEPVYVWNNTGFAGSNTIVPEDYQPDTCGNGLTMVASGFWQENRDYVYGGKPGYTKYTYPHPLRSDANSPSSVVKSIGAGRLGSGTF